MKKLCVFFCLMAILFFFCSKPSPTIQGAWKLVYQKISTPDTIIVNTIEDFPNPQIKIFTKSFFSFGYQDFTGAFSAGGKYTIQGNECIETPLYNYNKGDINSPIKLSFEIKNDTLIQFGVVDSTNNLKLLEKYIRLE